MSILGLHETGHRRRRAYWFAVPPRQARRRSSARRWSLATLAIVSLLWRAAAASAQLAAPVSGDAASAERSLTDELAITAALAHDALSALQSGTLSAGMRGSLAAHLDQLQADDLLVRARHADVQRVLDQRGIAGLAQARLAEAAAEYRARIATLATAVEATALALRAAAPSGDGALRQAIATLAQELDARLPRPDRTPIGVSLPFRSLGLPQIEPQALAAIVPAYNDPAFRAPADVDLHETPDVTLDPDVLAQARGLGLSPIAIFEFVQNEIDVEFYEGSIKGSHETLRQRSGNDTDQASLLIALMRASNIPARYVRGVIRLTAAQAASWTGVANARLAAGVFSAAGIPFRTTAQGPAIGSFEIEHTWVEVAVAYRNYRGAPIAPGARSWIPLDPSFTSSTYAAGVDVRTASGFNAAALVASYLGAPQTLSPADFYNKRVTDYLTQNRPDLTYEQVSGKRTTVRAPLGLLPNTLPFEVVSVQQESVALDDRLRHHVRFTARGDGGVAFDIALPASAVVGRRVTVSYLPDSVDDQNTINAFLGLDNTPAYLVRLRPVLKIDGVVQAAGERSVQMGDTHRFTIEMQGTRSSVPIENTLTAGGYYAVGFGGLHVVHTRDSPVEEQDTEEDAARILDDLAQDYLARWNQAEASIASQLRVMLVRPLLTETMVGTVHNRTVLFGQTQAMVWRGVFVDADLRITEPIVADGADEAGRAVQFRQLSSLAGSMAESDVLEANLGVDSISAAKAIQLAHAAGTVVEEIDGTNAALVIAGLTTADVVKTDIADGVRQGWLATTPQRDIVHNIWTGIGYILRDPTDGSAGYFISGGLSGGSTSQDPATWVKSLYRDRLGRPYAPTPDTDPSKAASVVVIPVSDGQTGVVGQTLPKPLAALVRDRDGKPVQGATVTFRIAVGDGTFGGSDTTTAATDALGIALANPTLGKKTSAAPVYVLDHPGDTHVTKVGQNLVNASIETRDGTVTLSAPFVAFGHPDSPHDVVKLFGDGGVALAGTKGSTMLALVADQYGNPVSNVPLTFSARDAHAQVGDLPAGAKNLALIPTDPPCAIAAPVLGECGGKPAITISTSVFGVGVDPILGNTEGTRFEVAASVAAGGLSEQVFTQFSFNTRIFNGSYHRPALYVALRELVNDSGGLLNAAKVGTPFRRRLETLLYVVEDDFLIERISPTCVTAPAPAPPCFRIKSLQTSRTRLIDNNKDGAVSFPALVPNAIIQNTREEMATVTFTATEGGGTTDPVVTNSSHGVFSTTLTVGLVPQLNRVTTTATARIWVPYQDLNEGTVSVVLADLKAGQAVTSFDTTKRDPAGQGPLPIATGPVQTLTHEVYGVQVTMTLPDLFPLGDEGLLTTDAPVKYTIAPAAYQAEQADLDIFEVDSTSPADADGCTCKWVGLIVGNKKSGDGVSTFFRGEGFDRTKSYRLQMLLNRGSDAALTSDKRNLAFLTGVATYDFYKPLPVGSPGHPNGGLQYENAQPRFVRGAVVSLLDAAGNVVAVTNTTEKGFFSFPSPATAKQLKVRIGANIGPNVPHLIVADNTNPNPLTAPYVIDCPIAWNPASSAAVDAHMDSGWNPMANQYNTPSAPCPGAVAGTRAAAPFAIADTIYQAEKVLRRVDPSIVFPFLMVYWSPSNTSTASGNPAIGQIGTTYYSSGAGIYVLGDVATDTDEYDSHVLLHEWGHYFQDKFSRDDTLGDTHNKKDILDPRVAFSEGFGNAVSGILLDDPDPVYIDTIDSAQTIPVGTIDVDANSVPNSQVVTDNFNPAVCVAIPPATIPAACTWRVDGYYSEGSVEEVFWDLYTALGLKPMYQALRDMRTLDSFSTVFGFLHRLKQGVPNEAELIDQIAGKENIPVSDEWGDPGTNLYTRISILDSGVDEAAKTVGINNVSAASGRPFQTWAGRVAGGTPDPGVNSPDRWDAAPLSAQPQAAADQQRSSPCTYTDSTGNHPCLSTNKLYDHVLLRFTIEAAGNYTIVVTPTTGTGRFDKADVLFKLYRAGKALTDKWVDAGDKGDPETLPIDLQPGTYTIDVASWGKSALFTVRIHQ